MTFKHHILSVLVENKPGVLARVSGLFARRGYNIFSLAVAPTEDERFSRITIVVDVESAPLEQMVKQLFKLIHVVKITELDPRSSVERELLLVTVSAAPEMRGQIIELVQVFGGRILSPGDFGRAIGFEPSHVSSSSRRSSASDYVRRRRSKAIVKPGFVTGS